MRPRDSASETRDVGSRKFVRSAILPSRVTLLPYRVTLLPSRVMFIEENLTLHRTNVRDMRPGVTAAVDAASLIVVTPGPFAELRVNVLLTSTSSA